MILDGSGVQIDVATLRVLDGRLSLDGEEQLVDSIGVYLEGASQANDGGSLVLLNDGDDNVTRTESINSLSGEGEVYLNRNTLNVQDGGDFSGEIFGSGTVNVANGTFTISNNLTSDEGGLTVQNEETVVAGGTTVEVEDLEIEQNPNDPATTPTLYVQGTGTGTGQQANVNVETVTVGDGTTLQMGEGDGYDAGEEGFSNVNANGDVTINGTVSGNGTITGDAIVITGTNGGTAQISPGDSPGIQVLNGGPVTFSDASTLEIEVLDSTLAAGTGFDQIQIGDTVTFEGTSELEIIELSGDAGYSAANWDLGNTAQFIQVDPLGTSGQFGTVTHTNSGAANGSFAVNLSTGNLVGLGTQDIDDAATTDNQKAMIDQLRVSTSGDAEQFYGGTFVEDLAAAWGAGSNLQTVFDLASPEAYAGLGGQAQASAMTVMPEWVGEYLMAPGQQQVFFDVGRDSFGADDKNGQHMRFGVNATNTTAGFSWGGEQMTVMVGVGMANTDLRGDYTSGNGQGVSGGVAILGAMPGTENLIWNVGLSYAGLSTDGTCTANNGQVAFDNVNSSATQVNFGVEFANAGSRLDWGGRARLAFGSAKSDSFAEAAQSGNTLDALNVEKASYDYSRLDLGVQVGSQVARGTRLFGMVEASTPLGDASANVTASQDGGSGRFSVLSRGLSQFNLAASIGVTQQISETGSLTFDVGGVNNWKGSTDMTANFAIRFDF